MTLSRVLRGQAALSDNRAPESGRIQVVAGQRSGTLNQCQDMDLVLLARGSTSPRSFSLRPNHQQPSTPNMIHNTVIDSSAYCLMNAAINANEISLVAHTTS